MVKQPNKTRQAIVEAAFWEIYRNGFQTASLDRILEGTGLTKGALYHHFPNKAALGYAVIDEVVRPRVVDRWLGALANSDNPIEGLRAAVRRSLDESPAEMVQRGCPLFNLSQEMASVDEGFGERLGNALDAWRSGIAKHLARGQAAGLVRRDLDPEATAAFLVASFEGIRGMARAHQDAGVARRLLETYTTLIDSLRSVPASARDATSATF